ncbi:MAG: hypothetical protein MJ215_05160 [Spirochaetia bacterium]|nr:hypothetical protein [Spirochaetia bacterium]
MKKIYDKLFKCGATAFAMDNSTEKICIKVDTSAVIKSPSARTLFMSGIDKLMLKNDIVPEIIIGLDNAGIAFASMIALRLNIPMAYIRKAAKDHGKKNRIEGRIEAGKKALVVTDSLYDKSMVDYVYESLAETKCDVIGILPVYSDIEGENIYPLISYDKLLKRAVKKHWLNVFMMEETSENAGSSVDPDEMMAKNAAEILLEINAVSLSPDKPFKYASGILSPIYCDNRLLISSFEKWMMIVSYMINIIKEKIGVNNFDVIGGTATAGIPHGMIIANSLGKPFVWIKSDLSSELEPGTRVLIVEDLISTGKSSIGAVDVVRNAGCTVSDCISIFTYEMEKADDMFVEKECHKYSVSNFSTLVQVASEKKLIAKSDIDKICEWNSDPEGWGKKYGFEK